MKDNMRGALLMMGAMAGFTFNDAMIKSTGGEVPLYQLIFIRGVLASAFLCVLALRLGAIRFDLRRRDWILLLLRSAAEVGATVFFLSALFRMPLANVTAVLQILPLSVALGAALLLGEPVGWRRWIAIGVGFCGMLLILRPGPEGFSQATLFALITVVCATLRDLVTRLMSVEVPSIMVSLTGAISVMLFAGLASISAGWDQVSGDNLLRIFGAAVFILAAYLCSVMVMRVGEVGFTAPFRYTGLIWALILGYLIWGDWPSSLTLIGAAIVVAMGLFALWREARISGKNRPHPVR